MAYNSYVSFKVIQKLIYVITKQMVAFIVDAKTGKLSLKNEVC